MQSTEVSAVLVDLFVLHAASKAYVAVSQLVEMLALRGIRVRSSFLSTVLDELRRKDLLTSHHGNDADDVTFHITQAGEDMLLELKSMVAALHRDISSQIILTHDH